MKNTTLWLLAIIMLVGFSNDALGQKKKKGKEGPDDFTFSEGREIKERGLSAASAVSGTTDDKVYMVGFRPFVLMLFPFKFTSLKYVFQSFDLADMDLAKKYKVNAFGKQFKKNFFFATTMVDNTPYLFTYEKGKSSGKKNNLILNYYTIDPDDMKPSKKTKLATFKGVDMPHRNKFRFVMNLMKNMGSNETNGDPKLGISGMQFKTSEDGKITYIINIDPDEKKKKNSKANVNFSIKAFDKELGLLWEKDDKISLKSDYSAVTGVDVDNTGNVYFVVKDYKEDSKGREAKSKTGTRNYTYSAYLLNKDLEEAKEIELNLGDNKFIDYMTVKNYDDSLGASCIGYYYDDNKNRKEDELSGVFTAVVDKVEGTAASEEFYDFDEKMYEQKVARGYRNLLGKKKSSNDEDGNKNLVLKKIYVRPDGNIVVIGEEYFHWITVETTGTGTSRTTRTVHHYKHDNIIVTCISPNDGTQWSVRIPKYQYQQNAYINSSFVASMKGNNLFMVYSDNVDNTKNTTTGTFSDAVFDGKKTDLVLVRIDEDGNVTKDKLLNGANVKGNHWIAGGLSLKDNKIVIPVIKGLGRLYRYDFVDLK